MGCSPASGAGTSRGSRHERRRRQAGRPERRCAVAVPADRRLRLPLGLPHRRARGPRRRDRLALRAAFDAPSVFGSLLDRQAGFFRLGPFGINYPSSRSYEPGTNVLETTWKTPSGWIVVSDALTIGPRDSEDAVTPHTRPPADDDGDHMLVRTVECIDGQVEVELVCEPVFDYGRTPAEWTLVDDDRHAADATGAGQTIRLRSDLALGIEGNRVRGRHTLGAGRARLLRPLLGRGPRRARRTSTRPTRGWPRRRASGGPGSAGRASPTTAGATRSSARRWRSRA